MSPALVRTAVASAETGRVRPAESRAEDVEAPAVLAEKDNLSALAPELEAEGGHAESAGAEARDAAVSEIAPEGPPIEEVLGDDEEPVEGSEETEPVEPVTGVPSGDRAL